MQRFQVDSDNSGNGSVELSSVTIEDIGGTIGAGDVADLKVYVSTDTNFGDANDVLIGSLATYDGSSSSVALDQGTVAERTVSTGTPKYVFVVYDVAEQAEGKTIQSRVTAVGVAAPDTGVTSLTYDSNAVSVNVDTLLTSANTAVQSANIDAGTTGVVMQHFQVDSNTAGNNNVVLSSLSISDLGNAGAGDWDALKIYLSSDTTLDGGDLLLNGTTAWDGSAQTIAFDQGTAAERTVTNGTSQYIIIVYDVANEAEGQIFEAQVTAVNVAAPDTGVTGLDLRSNIVTTNVDNLTANGNTPVASGVATLGQTGVVMQYFQVSTDTAGEGSIVLRTVNLDDLGTAAAGDWSAVKFYLSADATLDGGDLLMNSDTAFAGTSKSFNLDLGTAVERTISFGTPQYVFVVYDVDAGATIDNTLQSRVTAVGAGPPDNGATGLTMDSNILTIKDTKDTLTSTGNTAVQTGTVDAGATGVVMQYIQLDNDNASNGSVELTSVTVDDLASIGSGDLADLKIYIDTDTNLTGAVLIGNTNSFDGTSTSITLNQGTAAQRTVTSGSPKYLFVVYDVADQAESQAMLSRVTDIVAVAPDIGLSGQTYDSNNVLVDTDTLVSSNNTAVQVSDVNAGTAGVVMQYFQVDSDTAGNNSVVLNSLTMNDQGNAGNGDWDAVKLYLSADTTLDGGDLLMNSDTVFTGASKSFALDLGTDAQRTVTNGTSQYVIVVYDIAAGANAGRTLQSQVTAVGVASPDTGVTGLTYNSNTLTITVDTPPDTVITAPSAAAVLSGASASITGTATAGTNALDHVSVSTNNGASWANAIGTTSWSYSWTLPSEDYVAHTILAKAVDTTALEDPAPASVSVFVDTQAPINLANSSPADVAIGVATSVSLQAVAASDNHPAAVEYYFEYDTVSDFTGSPSNSGWQTATSWAPGFAGGTTYYWHVKARDGAGNETVYTSTRSFTTSAACTPGTPTIVITPSAQFVPQGQTVNYTVTVTNTDAGCPDTTFNLSITPLETDGTNFVIPSNLSPASLTIVSGAQGTATLTVEAAATGALETLMTTTVRALDAAASPPAQHTAVTVDANTIIRNFNPLIHSSATTGSTKWGGDWGLTSDSQYGEFTCSTCHQRGSGNIKRVKTDIAVTDAAAQGRGEEFPIKTAGGSVNFQAVSGANSFGNDQRTPLNSSNFICEACHTLTSVHLYNSVGIADTNHKGANLNDCVQCHKHSQGFKPLDCDECHSDNGRNHSDGTESLNMHTVHNASGYVGDCNDCHAHNGPGTPGDGVHDDGTVDFGGTYMGAGVSYSGTAFGDDCTSANGCHNSDAVGDWSGESLGADRCADCHDSGAKLLSQGAYPPTSGNHPEHLANSNYVPNSCEECHPHDGDASGDLTVHVDTNIDDTVSYDDVNLTCTNSCHIADASPNNKWDTTNGALACQDCHASSYIGLGFPPVGAGTVDHDLSRDDGGTFLLSKHGECGTCHGYSETFGAIDKTADGGDAYNVSSYHMDTQIEMNGWPTNSTVDAGYDESTWGCTRACHDASKVLSDSGRTVQRHRYGSGSCDGCHGGSGEYWPQTVSTASGDYPNRAGTHDNHVLAISQYLYGLDLAGLVADGASETKQKAICAFCHPTTAGEIGGSGHDADGGDSRADLFSSAGQFLTYDGAGSSKTDSGSSAYTPNASYATGGSCSNLSCHNLVTTPSNWSTPPASPTCAICHTQPSFGGDAHDIHVGTNAGKEHVCTECHVNNGTYPTATTNLAHADGLVDLDWNDSNAFEDPTGGAAWGDKSVTYGGTLNYNDGNYGTCASAACHNNKTTPSWSQNSTTAGNCTICHTSDGSARNPSSGLHNGSAPTVTGVKHDETLDATNKCEVCHTGLAAKLGGTHIDTSFTGDTVANLGLFDDYTQAAPNQGSCYNQGAGNEVGVGGCHDGAGDAGSWQRLWDATVHYDPADADPQECKGCHGGFDGNWNFATGAVGDGNTDHTANWDGAGVSDVIGKHTGTTEDKRCFVCHIYDDSDAYTQNAGNHIGWNGNTGNNSTYHGDGNITMSGPSAMDYDSGTGGCATTCHASETGHYFNSANDGSGTVDSSNWPVDTVNGKPTLACTTCHDGSGSGALAVGPSSSHVTVGTNPGYDDFAAAGFGCEACHPGGANQHKDTASTVLIKNNPAVGITYNHQPDGTNNGFVLGGTYATGNSEAEICWGCHSNSTYQATLISEWGANSGTGSTYNYGWLHDGSYSWSIDTEPADSEKVFDWSGGNDGASPVATWSSPKFRYKTAAIQSSHSANNIDGTSTGPGLDIVDEIRCSYCHNVHAGTQGDGATAGAPYLRGSWKGNPYREDGAPRWESGLASQQHSYTPQHWGNVPRGSTANNEYGGYQIDQNNGNPTSTFDLDNSAGLCKLCHTHDIDGNELGGAASTWTDKINAMNYYGTGSDGNALPSADWVGTNGHSNAVLGGDGSNKVNIFTTAWRNDNIDTQGAQPGMGYANHGTAVGYGFRGWGTHQRSFELLPSMDGQLNSGQPDRPYGGQEYQWGATVEADLNGGTAQTQYHKFSCSKCHNPHASRLPRLMITNCLDTQHNTWDDPRTGINAVNTNPGDGKNANNIVLSAATSPDNWGRTWSNTTSAQNCHRRTGTNNATYPAGVNNAPGGNDGWNNVTPWSYTLEP